MDRQAQRAAMTDLHTAARRAQQALRDAADAIAGRLENPATAMHNALIAESALRAALEAQQEPAQPQGWVLVPEEPTPEMCAAGVQALYAASVGDIETTGSEVRITYSAMLAARPKETT